MTKLTELPKKQETAVRTQLKKRKYVYPFVDGDEMQLTVGNIWYWLVRVGRVWEIKETKKEGV